MRRSTSTTALLAVALAAIAVAVAIEEPAGSPRRTAVVDPGPPGGTPSDAVVLFDGSGLGEWTHRGGGPARWTVEDGVLVAGRDGGDLYTRRQFGDLQLHLEWMVPLEEGRQGESRGNSGIKLHACYEIQILDSWGAESGNASGQCGAVYKQHPPLVNACRKPGEWQSYDIVFRAPRWDASGDLARPGRFTVLHNGVLVQDGAEFHRRTNSSAPPPKEYRQPFFLQYHGSPVRFRNIWARELEPLEE